LSNCHISGLLRVCRLYRVWGAIRGALVGDIPFCIGVLFCIVLNECMSLDLSTIPLFLKECFGLHPHTPFSKFQLIIILSHTDLSQMVYTLRGDATNISPCVLLDSCPLSCNSFSAAHVALILCPTLFMPFCFNTACQYTPLLNVYSLIFGLTYFGCLCSVMPSPTYSIISYRNMVFKLELFDVHPPL
jgi:hypothetical protein